MWKNCNVVMLPTNQKAYEGMLALSPNLYSDGVNYLDLVCRIEMQDYLKVWARNGLLTEGKDARIQAGYQHLYVISNNEIKEGDWYIDDCNKVRQSAISDKNYWKSRFNYRKIIATTDDSLKTIIPRHNDFDSEYSLPSIPQQFIQHYIEEYNKGNVIDKVEIEYEEEVYGYGKITNLPIKSGKEILKINSNNIINIKQIKDSWSREELTDVIEYYLLSNELEILKKTKRSNIKNWIKENL